MPVPMNLNTPEHWNEVAEGYAQYVAPVLLESFAEEFVDRMQVHENAEVLDVAAGSGALTETLARRIKSLLATDFSPKMVEILHQHMNKNGIKNVKVEAMDGQALKKGGLYE
jgi:2-polyprenyl-3-methyl-5-hydroxy-6-metoxy-1,4-benzoquinol methylase